MAQSERSPRQRFVVKVLQVLRIGERQFLAYGPDSLADFLHERAGAGARRAHHVRNVANGVERLGTEMIHQQRPIDSFGGWLSHAIRPLIADDTNDLKPGGNAHVSDVLAQRRLWRAP
jgi:hypothetical protein